MQFCAFRVIRANGKPFSSQSLKRCTDLINFGGFFDREHRYEWTSIGVHRHQPLGLKAPDRLANNATAGAKHLTQNSIGQVLTRGESS
ncbi:hypothetical protein PEP31012_01790 [Pandoraea eparura]|uniref:Uncharacterized protein n=1 Tax=Pandoraea eparura TaxID=2508291 RepID=A0A5E4U3W9_9BURK|nr:hypothetical protein PEP31012_01790 [Pandoraea eparura]